MSTKPTNGKKTKGKQKIEIKKVEAYGDRMTTFSKRKAGIYKKMNELITMCGVSAAFLIFSQAGKPYSFSHPSMEEVANKLEPSAKDDDGNKSGPLVVAYKQRKIKDLMKEYLKLNEQLEMETVKLKNLKESRDEKELSKMWWNIPHEGGLSVEELQRRHLVFSELHDFLGELGKDGDASSSGGGQA